MPFPVLAVVLEYWELSSLSCGESLPSDYGRTWIEANWRITVDSVKRKFGYFVGSAHNVSPNSTTTGGEKIC